MYISTLSTSFNYQSLIIDSRTWVRDESEVRLVGVNLSNCHFGQVEVNVSCDVSKGNNLIKLNLSFESLILSHTILIGRYRTFATFKINKS